MTYGRRFRRTVGDAIASDSVLSNCRQSVCCGILSHPGKISQSQAAARPHRVRPFLGDVFWSTGLSRKLAGHRRLSEFQTPLALPLGISRPRYPDQSGLCQPAPGLAALPKPGGNADAAGQPSLPAGRPGPGLAPSGLRLGFFDHLAGAEFVSPGATPRGPNKPPSNFICCSLYRGICPRGRW